MRESGTKHEFHTRLLQQFHNYLASAGTLVDHTRRIADEEKIGPELLDLYRDRVSLTFAVSPVARFIKDLRKYFLHYGLPIVLATWDEVGPDASQINNSIVWLDIGAMRAWEDGLRTRGDSWMTMARPFR